MNSLAIFVTSSNLNLFKALPNQLHKFRKTSCAAHIFQTLTFKKISSSRKCFFMCFLHVEIASQRLLYVYCWITGLQFGSSFVQFYCLLHIYFAICPVILCNAFSNNDLHVLVNPGFLTQGPRTP